MRWGGRGLYEQNDDGMAVRVLRKYLTARCAAGLPVFFAMLVIALHAGCRSSAADGDKPAVTGGDPALADQSLSLRVMSFNIEWGGTHVRFGAVAEAIEAAGADIVGIQEAEGNLARLATDLGWHYNLRTHVIAKYPIIEPPEAAGRYVLVEVQPGRVVAIANLHLPPTPSGAAWLHAGRETREVLAMERAVRLRIAERFIDALPFLAQQEVPVFLSGDFNSPSHQDWTEETIGRFPHRDRVVPWPVTRAAAEAGLRDSFRDIHQSPLEHPGFTWWAGRPRIDDFNPTDENLRTRIDFLWYGGPAEVTDSRLVGEAGAPEVGVVITPWPSDHRAVVSDFEVIPAPMPHTVAALQRVHESGTPLNFVFRNRTPTGSLVVERHQSEVITERRIRLGMDLGLLMVPDDFLLPGRYEVSLGDGQGIEVSRNEFWILSPDAKPALEIGGRHFASGEPLPVAWRDGPGNRYDWIGIYEASSTKKQSYLAWNYLDARSSGDMQLSGANAREGWPLPPGRYLARMLLDDGYTVLAESGHFTVE